MLEWIRTEDRTSSGRDRKEGHEAVLDVAKARTRDSLRAFKKLTRRGRRQAPLRGGPAADRAPRGSGPLTDEARHRTERSLRKLIKKYRRTLADEHHPLEEFRYVHMARKVVGVGSVGTRAWVFLMIGVDDATR